MSHLTDVIIGSVTAGVCLVLAVPTLYWFLPAKRRRIFPVETDPRALLQLGFGLACMAMAFADALCRFIPHRELDLVHPVFFLTTVAFIAMLAPKLYRALNGRPEGSMGSLQLLLLLATFVAIPLGTVIHAFLV